MINHPIKLLSVRIDNLTYADAMSRIEDYLREPGLHHIATVNPEFVVMAQTNAEFMRVLNSTALSTPDGVGLLWAAKRLGQPFQERVTGQELVDRIAALATEKHYPIYFLGAREGIAEQAAQVLQKKYSRLEIAGCYAGSPKPEDDQTITDRINQSNAKILLVAYGPPKQELWIARNASRLQNISVAMGVGGTFDTLSGILPRAPQWIRDVGFEWTYRLIREPWRIKRQMTIPYFMWLIITQGKQKPDRFSR